MDEAFKNCVNLSEIILPDEMEMISYRFLYNCYKVKKITIPKNIQKIGSYPFEYSSITKAIFQEGTTNITNSLFHNAIELKDVILPSSLEKIGEYAFNRCTQLTEIKIPENVTTIGQYAFSLCGLISIILPNKITVLNNGLFKGCKNLTKIEYFENITSIGIEVFRDCIKLANIKLSDAITSIGGSAFENCQFFTEIILPNKLTSISNNLCKNCKQLKTIMIPQSVTKIGSGAFWNCTNLEIIELHDRITYIGDCAFASCSKLEPFPLPNRLQELGYRFIAFCPKIQEITIPKSLRKVYASKYNFEYPFHKSSINKVSFEEGTTNIVNNLFNEASSLKEVILPLSLLSIGDYAFTNCSLNKIDIPENVTTIGQFALAGTNLTSIFIPNKITIISDYLFNNCSNLSTITLPPSIEKINDKAFYNCVKLENIELPDSITSIRGLVFYNCRKLSELILPNKLEYVGYNFLENCTNIHSITIPQSLKGWINLSPLYPFYPFTKSFVTKVIFEEGTLKIPDYFLCGKNTQITDVVLPSSVLNIGQYAFFESKLTKINIPMNVSFIGQYAFANSKLESIVLPNEIKTLNEGLFKQCYNLTEIILPQNLTTIRDEVFYNCRFENIELPKKVTFIGNSAFYFCINILKIELPNQVKTIGNLTFYNCKKLSELILPNQIEYIGYQFIGLCSKIQNITIPKSLKGVFVSKTYPFTNCSITKVIFEEGTKTIAPFICFNAYTVNEVILPSSLLKIGEYAFGNCKSITKIDIPKNVTNIFQNALMGTSITSIVLPSKIKFIHTGLFTRCSKLKSVNLPKDITIINPEAFYNCISLEKMELSDKITSIGCYAFSYCKSLTEIVLPNKLAIIDKYLFSGCNQLKSIVLPQNVTTIMQHAFYECSSLIQINCPYKLTKIESSAFQHCTSLTKYLLHSDVVSFGSNVFANCPSLTLYVVAGSEAEDYAKISNIEFTYYLSSVTLNTTIINNSDISGMKLILKDCITDLENIISLTSNSNQYLFYGLLIDHIYNLTLINKYGMFVSNRNPLIPIDNHTNIEIYANNTYSINITVLDVYLNDVTSQTKIHWYDSDENYLQQSSNLSQMINETKLFYDIELNEKLSIEYNSIQLQTLIVGKKNDLTIYLQPIQKVNLTGTVVNEENDPVFSANILVSQILNGKYQSKNMLTTDISGNFATEIYKTSLKLSISGKDFISKIIEINEVRDDFKIGNVSISMITGDTIFVDINYKKSVIEEDEASISQLSLNPSDFKLNLYNSITNEEIQDFIFQNNKLIFLNSSNLEEAILINLSVNSNEFNPVTTYLEPNISNITITLTQKGSLMIMYEKNENAYSIVMIYNAKGKLVNKFDLTLNNATSTFLEDGEYTIIAMGKSLFFSNIQTLNNLRFSKMIENIDYVSKKETVSSGKIKLVIFNNVPKFNENKFYYTDNEKTIFIPNKASAIEGSFFSFKSHLEFKDQYKNNVSNIKIIIEIPDNCEYLPESLIIDKNIVPFTINENKIIIPIDINADILRFCLIPTVKGSYIVNAYVEFLLNDETILQPIESAKFEAKEMDFYVPEKTGMKSIVSFGVAPLKSKIFLYCDDILVGEAQSDSKGDWLIEFDLIKHSTYSKHLIYIKIELSDGIFMTSKSKKLLFSQNYIDVYQIVFYVDRQKIVYDYLRSNKNIYYSVPVRRKIQMTILVNFTQNNPEIVKNVNLIITQLDNNVIKIPVFYNEDKKLWMTIYYFESSSSPVGFEVSYECDEDITFPNELLYEPVNLSAENIKEFEDSLESFDYIPELIENSFSNEKGIGKVIHKITLVDEYNNNTKDGYSEISVSSISDEEIESIKQSDEYMRIYDESGNEFYIKQPNGFKFEFAIINPINKTITTFSMSEPIIEDFDEEEYDEDEEILLGLIKFTKTHYNNVNNWMDNEMKKVLNIIYKYLIKICNKKFGNLCSPLFEFYLKELIGVVEEYLKYVDIARTFTETIEAYETSKEYTWQLAKPEAQCIPDRIKDQLQRKVYFYFGMSLIKMLTFFLKGNFIVLWVIEKAIEVFTDKQLESFDKLYDQYKCRPQIPAYPNSNSMQVTVYNPIIDPSGYVYEAVESNRIKDVTTTIFEKVTKVDLYGDEYDIAEIWNAQLYGQKNPLLTDESGWYAWDVPKGLWQVRYEKINYETKYSDWLPVPPPQLDVNIPLVSYAQPEIKRISAYENCIEIEFTKYMNLDKLNLDKIIITNNSNIVKGEIIYDNKEIDPNNNTINYASLLHFKPEKSLQKNKLINVFISKNVTSYSGVTMNTDFIEMIEIKMEPKITIDSEVSNITYGNSKNMIYSVDITPFESIKGKKLLLQSDSPNIVEIESESIEINNDGKIIIPTTILLPGVAHIEMKIEGTGIKKTKTINIDLPKPQLNPVVISINTESCVKEYTAVNIYSNMEDSIIYYSTNPSINLDDFKIYHGSIIIKEDTLLSAYAHHESYKNSEITSYLIKVCKNKQIMITFDANEGITDISSKYVNLNENIGFLPTPIRNYYTFCGWFLELSFENLISNETKVSFSKNTILYAKWTPNMYVISFETNGGSHVNDINQPHGTKIKEPSSPTKNGYEFIGWYEDVELSIKFDFNLMPTKNITLYAGWNDNKEISSNKLTQSISTIINSNNPVLSYEPIISNKPNSPKESNSSNKKIVIIGCVVGCVVLITVLIIIVIVVKMKKRAISNFNQNEDFDESVSF